jgi:hypothetical protein
VKSRVSLSADQADAIAISAASEGKLFFGRKNSMSSWPGVRDVEPNLEIGRG